MIRGELRYFLRGFVGVPALLFLFLCLVYGKHLPTVLDLLRVRSSQLLTGDARFQQVTEGFCANVWISIIAMVFAMVGGTLLGLGLIAHSRATRAGCGLIMNVLRNSPWLVVLYAMLYLLPFEFTLFGKSFSFSPAWKAVVGLALPVAANFAEIFRGGLQAIPSGQWESARSLGYRRIQVLRHVIIPQAVPLMLPNLMNLYAALFIGTSLIVVTGVTDVLTMARTIIATDGETIATAIYLYVLLLFFLFSFPVVVGSRWLELKLQNQP